MSLAVPKTRVKSGRKGLGGKNKDCSTQICVKKTKKYLFLVASNGMMFKPHFTKSSHYVHKLIHTINMVISQAVLFFHKTEMHVQSATQFQGGNYCDYYL